jgi:hypothetical protein
VRILIAAGLLLAVASVTAETAYYRVELVPSGSLVSIGAPAVRGTTVLIHGYPDGKLMSIRKSDVRSVSPITAQEASKPAQKSLVAIGDLPMQGGGVPAGSASAPGSASARSPATRAPLQGPRIVPTSDGLAVTSSAPNPK